MSASIQTYNVGSGQGFLRGVRSVLTFQLHLEDLSKQEVTQLCLQLRRCSGSIYNPIYRYLKTRFCCDVQSITYTAGWCTPKEAAIPTACVSAMAQGSDSH